MKLQFFKGKFTFNHPFNSWSSTQFREALGLLDPADAAEPVRKKVRESQDLQFVANANADEVKRVMLDLIRGGKVPIKLLQVIRKSLATRDLSKIVVPIDDER